MQRRQPAPSQQPQRQPAPSQQAPASDAGPGAQFERHTDQRYDGYTEPKPAASPQGRGQAGAAHAWQGAPRDLSDPYSTDAGWRPPPRPKERKAQPDNAAAFRPGYGADAKGPPDRAPPRAFEPAPPVASESRRPQAPAAGHHPRYEPPGERPMRRPRLTRTRVRSRTSLGRSPTATTNMTPTAIAGAITKRAANRAAASCGSSPQSSPSR